MSQNEEGSETEWYCTWVPCTVYLRERERERERGRQTEKHHHNREQKRKRKDMYA